MVLIVNGNALMQDISFFLIPGPLWEIINFERKKKIFSYDADGEWRQTVDHYYQIVKRGTEGGGVYVLGHKL